MYIEMISKFWAFAEKEKLSTVTISFYLFLLNHWNAQGDNEFVLSDVKISEKLSITRNTVKSTKEKLRNIGLIHFQSKNGYPTVYKILKDSSYLSLSNEASEVKENVSTTKIKKRNKAS